ncbi:hypothetical protein EV690_1373 [Celerinatantimonas diazotrophica]|uniref:Uncharacterized protein n=1 Tax=Celerinatantimonas diazotrophica TaxID=412034 RepID=A0A4R1K3X0_9GAMM|nr:hypothetical protein EV690_1373 [Celerinatantimonas diazotrophica]CAG9298259.1 hypothetical protein CEDIAZO_03454 [Celerinatantimonas diazotrophica]
MDDDLLFKVSSIKNKKIPPMPSSCYIVIKGKIQGNISIRSNICICEIRRKH